MNNTLPHPLAGKPAPAELLINVAKLETDYFSLKPKLTSCVGSSKFGLRE